MMRRTFTTMLAAGPLLALTAAAHTPKSKSVAGGFSYLPGITVKDRLKVPTDRKIKVAFAINPGVQVIDLAGPWEVFQDTSIRIPGANENKRAPAFELFTVSERLEALRGSGGLQILPDFTIDKAPQPDIVVIPHFSPPSPAGIKTSAIHDWIKATHANVALTMSICTGAYQLARTGLLDGLPMTTNQLEYDRFAAMFPHIDLRRGPRFVEADRIATAGGLSAGIDLALRVVSRCFGSGAAQQTADVMEYVGDGWE